MGYMADPSLSRFLAAAALVWVAVVFDVLDGRIARWRHTHSALGRELALLFVLSGTLMISKTLRIPKF